MLKSRVRNLPNPLIIDFEGTVKYSHDGQPSPGQVARFVPGAKLGGMMVKNQSATLTPRLACRTSRAIGSQNIHVNGIRNIYLNR